MSNAIYHIKECIGIYFSLYIFHYYFFFFYIKRISRMTISLWQVISHDRSQCEETTFSFVRGNWIEISLWCFGKTTTRNRCRDRFEASPSMSSLPWFSRLFSTNVMVLQCQRLDVTHSLRHALFLVTRETYHENISSQHCSLCRQSAELILFRV